ncbi:hypothetical protein P872_17575 [Rhodonellum psychrophilum GCM71 = DSM 17998]|uniref:Uncharacterized protein n=1 Tax=Rhodonellum psychrophilum GCM71 = DSM 17998 TaxID=1123057 RepID=U5C4L7_9BACT|nr:hypothetical protein P872_17575 [Rhodonellum psychrophilum GCM71 = DSM 17998]
MLKHNGLAYSVRFFFFFAELNVLSFLRISKPNNHLTTLIGEQPKLEASISKEGVNSIFISNTK